MDSEAKPEKTSGLLTLKNIADSLKEKADASCDLKSSVGKEGYDNIAKVQSFQESSVEMDLNNFSDTAPLTVQQFEENNDSVTLQTETRMTLQETSSNRDIMANVSGTDQPSCEINDNQNKFAASNIWSKSDGDMIQFASYEPSNTTIMDQTLQSQVKDGEFNMSAKEFTRDQHLKKTSDEDTSRQMENVEEGDKSDFVNFCERTNDVDNENRTRRLENTSTDNVTDRIDVSEHEGQASKDVTSEEQGITETKGQSLEGNYVVNANAAQEPKLFDNRDQFLTENSTDDATVPTSWESRGTDDGNNENNRTRGLEDTSADNVTSRIDVSETEGQMSVETSSDTKGQSSEGNYEFNANVAQEHKLFDTSDQFLAETGGATVVPTSWENSRGVTFTDNISDMAFKSGKCKEKEIDFNRSRIEKKKKGHSPNKAYGNEGNPNKSHSRANRKFESSHKSDDLGATSACAEAWEPIDNRDKYEYFWKNHSPFSQWCFSKFYVEGVKYNCAEQFMMHRKAVMFEDEDSANKILRTPEPRKQKALGRKVKNFDQHLWDENCMFIVEEGNRAKFSQHIDLKNFLYSTYPRTLVEASPLDRIWGIGLTEDDPLAWDESTWDGKNLLGHALTRVRNQMMKDDGIIEDLKIEKQEANDE